MSDIFISYSRRDRSVVEPLAGALEHRGWSVWWDHRIVAGDAFDRVIEEAIQESRLVIVVWSQRSVTSDWVRAEASYALENDKLIPILIDDAKLPLRFINTHTLPFIDWDGSLDATTFIKLVGEIELLLHEAQPAASPPFAPNMLPAQIEPAPPTLVMPLANPAFISPAPVGGRRSRMLMFGGTAVAIVVAAGIGAAVMLHGSQPADKEPTEPRPKVPHLPPSSNRKRANRKPVGHWRPNRADQRWGHRSCLRAVRMSFLAARSALNAQAKFIASHPGIAVRIDSYPHPTDGNPAKMAGLADLRARNVKRELLKDGVNPNAVTTKTHADDAAAPQASGSAGPRVVLSADGG